MEPSFARHIVVGDDVRVVIVNRRRRRMEDLTRFALFLLSAPVVIVTGGVVLGLIGRYVTGRR